LLFAQPQPAQIGRDGIDGGLELQAVVHARINAAACCTYSPLARIRSWA
jgi:hypothetical protein